VKKNSEEHNLISRIHLSSCVHCLEHGHNGRSWCFYN